MATSRVLQLVLELRDEATKKMQSFSGVINDNAESIKRAGKQITAYGAAITGLAGLAVKNASDLSESINAVGVVFGEASEGILAIGETSATSLGLSKRAFNEMAVGFSAFGKTIAGEGGDVVSVIDDLSLRATDFASVMNLDVAEAGEKFKAGLAGQTEPLRQFGIDLSAVTVETWAYENGIVAVGEELTEAQKIQARYGSLMEQTAQVSGDFANTSEGLANQLRIQKATVEDLSSTIGTTLQPIIEDLINDYVGPLIIKLTDWIEQNPELTKKIVIVVGAIGALMLVLGPLLIILPGLTTAFSILGTIIAFIGGPITALIALVAALSAAWAGNWFSIREKTEGAIMFISDILFGWIDSITQLFTGAKDVILNIWSSIWDGIKSIVKAGAEAAMAPVRGLIKLLKAPITLSNKVSGLFGGKTKKFAKGGIINEPIVGYGTKTGTNYLMGEAGPEAVVPLGAGASISGGGGGQSIVVNVSNNTFMGTPQQFADQIQQILQKRLQGSLKF